MAYYSARFKMKKIPLYLLILTFLVGSAYAVTTGIYKVNSLRPPIEVSYAQQIKLHNLSLQMTGGTYVILEGPKIGEWYDADYDLLYTPKTNLVNNKEYVLSITAEDLNGRIRKETWTFLIELLAVQITLVEPEFGYTPVTPYNVAITTNRDVENCRYSYEDQIPYHLMSLDFTKINSTHLKITGLEGSNTIFVRCKDIFTEVDQYSTMLKLIYDPNKPLITSSYAKPNPVIEIINNELQTTLYVETNKPTVCKYSETEDIDFSHMDLDNKNDIYNGLFNGNDETDRSTYSAKHNKLLGNMPPGTLTNQKHTYKVACRSLAGLSSEVKEIPFSVNLSVPLQITIKSPIGPTNNTRVLLAVETNKQSSCLFGVDEATAQMPTTDRYLHQSTVQLTASGQYSYKVHCEHTRSQQADAVISFKLDLTPPSAPEIEAEDFACPNADGSYDIEAKWHSEENITSVDHYEYAIGSLAGSSNIVRWKQAGEEKEESNLNISNYSTVYWTVRAVDKAGNKGKEEYSAVDILDSDATECSFVANCNNLIIDGDETDTDCGGPHCPECAVGEFCGRDTDCESRECENGICVESNYCESDSDCGAGEHCENNECIQESCLDNAMNGYETDVDCGGGVCPDCEIGKGCSLHSDCISRSCQKNICAVATCTDGLSSGRETGVDCGGTDCPKCAVGQSCDYDSDCISGECYYGYCGEPSEQDSDNDGMPTDWETIYADCANLDPNNPEDADLDPDGDGLTNLEEYELKTDPCEAQEKQGISWLKILMIIGISLVLAVLAYFVLYPQIKKLIEKRRPKQQIRPSPLISLKAPQPIFRSTREAHERFMRRKQGKRREMSKIFDIFGKGPAKANKPELKKPEPQRAIPSKGKPAKEWVPLEELKKKKPFEKLEEIFKKKPAKKNIFEELKEIASGGPPPKKKKK